MQSKKLFTGGINTDDSPAFLKANEYVGALNVRFTGSDDGKTGIVTNIDGNSKRAFNPDGSIFTLPAGTNRTIGAYEDKTKKRIYFFNYNSSGSHGIYCYDQPFDCVYTVLLSANVTDGLGFSNDIHSVAMIGDILYWTDNVNPQRRINVEDFIKTYYASYATTKTGYSIASQLPQYLITMVRPQPMIPLTAAKYYDAGYVNNFIANESFHFCYRFVYRDFETSAFSALSLIVNYNGAGQNYNSIDITIPTSQKIEQDVQRIEIAAKYKTGGAVVIVKTFDKETDSTAMTAHNAGTALTFRFYNDVVGYNVDNATSVKQQDYIPVKSLALEIAKNRVFLGNNTEGYSTPSQTSLSVSASSTSGSTLSGNWWLLQWINPASPSVTESRYLLEINGMATGNGYHYRPSIAGWPTSYPASSYPATVDYSAFTAPDILGPSYSIVLAYFGVSPAWVLGFAYTGNQSNVINATTASLVNTAVFKTDSAYKVGIVFYDYAGRKCDVGVTKSVSTADRTYSTVTYNTSITWSLSNSGAGLLSEIPDWAYYYSIVMTKCQRTSSFIQLRSDGIQYINKNTSGAYDLLSSYPVAYSSNYYGLAIKASSMFGYGMGYTFSEGDLLKLYLSGGTTPYIVKVKDTYGDYIITDLINVGSISSATSVLALYELYTPIFKLQDDYYYETGNIYKINNPRTGSRQYATLTGNLMGDITIVQRSYSGTNYNAEAMSPNDLYWNNWYVNDGRTCVVSRAKQTLRKTNLRWSNIVTLGSENNGGSSFDYADFTDLPYELDSIQRLMLVNKIESEGTVMLAIGVNETASLYLGESQVFDNTGASFLAKSTGVVGNVNVLRGSYGTNNPESVAEYLGQVFWFDANKGSVIRYDVNGLIPISDYKMSVYWNKVSVDVRAGNKIFAGFDPYYNEFLLYAPRVSNSPTSTKLEDVEIASTLTASYAGSGAVTLTVTKGKLYKLSITAGHTLSYGGQVVAGGSSNNTVMVEATTGFTVTAGGSGSISYTEILMNQYEPYDSLGGVWCFKPEINKWTSKYSYRPEWMGRVANTLVSFKDGFCYTHNHYVSNTFYGQAYDSYLSFVHSDAGSTVKVYNSITVEGDTPYMVHTRTTNPYEQSTNLMSDEFRIIEGVNYGSLMRDRLSPNVAGTYDLKMLIGDRVRGEYAKFTILHRNPTSDKEIKFATISFNPSRGQKV